MQRTIRAPATSALLNEVFTPAYIAGSLLQTNPFKTAPRGRGERVLVWPGFGASYASTAALRSYLRLLGYRTSGWDLGVNSGDVLTTLNVLKKHVMLESENARIILVGWSLGRYLAREVARDCPDRVRHAVTLGSPVVGGPKYRSIARAFAVNQGSLDEIERLVDERYQRPLTVPVTALYSKSDGVVAWQACIDERSPNVEHVEVRTSHAGFGFDARAYQIVAERIAQHIGEAC